MNQERIDSIYKWAKKNYDKFFDIYQQGGSPSSLRTAERYDDICEICSLAEKAADALSSFRGSTYRMQSGVMENFNDMMSVSRGKTFTADEVRNWMEKMYV